MRRLRLRYLSGPRRGDDLTFSGPRVRIGRSRDNSLILTESDSPASSGHHAEAVVDAGGWSIVDVGSTNGTFVNGARVDRRRLRVGDHIAFGDDQFLVARSPQRTWLAAVALVALCAVVAGATYAKRLRLLTPAEQIAASAARSVYAVEIDTGGARSIIGTAFSVSDHVLATNAHVASVVRERAPATSADHGVGAAPHAVAVQGDTYHASRIVDVVLHPDWQPGSLRADVALLRVDGDALMPLTLADSASFARLHRGSSVVSFGFPAVSTDASSPRGRVSVDVVGDVRGEYLQAGLAIAPGTSGSPVFDDAGEVVAVVAAGDFVKDPRGMLTPSGSQANWAISVQRVRDLLAGASTR